MKLETWISAVALVFSAASLLGLFFSWRSLHATVTRSANDLVLQLDRIFLDRAKLRPFLYDRKDLPEACELREEVLVMGELCLDTLESIWDLRNEFSQADAGSWREWIHDRFESSVVMQGPYKEKSTDGKHGESWWPTIDELLRCEGCNDGESHQWAKEKLGHPDPPKNWVLARWRRTRC